MRPGHEAYQHRLWQHGQRGPCDRRCQPGFAPIKRIVQDARDKGAAIDATYGRRTRAVIITDSDHVVLSAFEPEEVLGRFEKEQDKPTV